MALVIPHVKSTKRFWLANRDRITVEPLPWYSPDYNPIEYLWKKTKKRANMTQYSRNLRYSRIQRARHLAYFAAHLCHVFGLFGLDREESVLDIKHTA